MTREELYWQSSSEEVALPFGFGLGWSGVACLGPRLIEDGLALDIGRLSIFWAWPVTFCDWIVGDDGIVPAHQTAREA